MAGLANRGQRGAPTTPFTSKLSPRQIATKAMTLGCKKLDRDDKRSRPRYNVRERLLLCNTIAYAEQVLNQRTRRTNRRVMSMEDDDTHFDESLNNNNDDESIKTAVRKSSSSSSHHEEHHSPLRSSSTSDDDDDEEWELTNNHASRQYGSLDATDKPDYLHSDTNNCRNLVKPPIGSPIVAL
ncbi:hypothetical protein BC941DRAFT_429253 [Chlamydoabsidia padenii]|nr:hypothetical protein BC941DRAFT_429253 [Chlamydoabsidia padenii]